MVIDLIIMGLTAGFLWLVLLDYATTISPDLDAHSYPRPTHRWTTTLLSITCVLWTILVVVYSTALIVGWTVLHKQIPVPYHGGVFVTGSMANIVLVGLLGYMVVLFDTSLLSVAEIRVRTLCVNIFCVSCLRASREHVLRTGPWVVTDVETLAQSV